MDESDEQYVVVVLDLDSDDPGLTSVSRPLSRENAETLANDYAAEHGLTRGVHVQTAQLGTPDAALAASNQKRNR